MSDHSVVIREIVSLEEHPNADRLEVAKVEGMALQFIVQKDAYYIGQEALVFQDDLILPPGLVKHFSLEFLSKGRVKQTKLRGTLSEGLLLPAEDVAEYSDQFASERKLNPATDDPNYDYSRILGVTRYIPPQSGQSAGSLPGWLEKYDLENIKRYPEILDGAQEDRFVLTEKLEGTNISVTLEDGEVHYYSRTTERKEGMYVQVAQQEGLDKVVRWIAQYYETDTVALRGEMVGTDIQKNVYDLPDKRIYVFDVMLDGDYMDFRTVHILSGFLGFRVVPPRAFMRGKDIDLDNIDELCTVKSYLGDTLAEGIVFRNHIHVPGERVIFKHRSSEYLANF